MKLNCNHIVLCTIGLTLLLSGCSGTRHVPEGEYLLRRSDITFKNSEPPLARRDRNALRNDLAPLQKQEPNNRVLFVPLRLMMYSSISGERNNWWTRFIQRAGEPPVIFDSTFAKQSVRQMQQYLVNKGHFNSEVHYVYNTFRSQRMHLVFHVNPRLGYHYRNVDIDVRDDSLRHLFDDWQTRTLIKSGDPYNVEVLNTERMRIERRLQNLGYFSFNRNNIEFSIDSSLNALLMDVTVIINPPRGGGHHEIHHFSDVYIFPDQRPSRSEGISFDTTTYRMPRSRRDTAMSTFHFIHSKPLQIRPQTIASKLAIQSGMPYSPNSVDRTYENLLDLRVFHSTNITIQSQPIDTTNPQHLLNTTVDVQQAPVNMWETEFEITNASSNVSNLQGAALNATFQNRNLFGGAEIFSLRLRGAVEMQYPLNPDLRRKRNLEFLDNYEIGIGAGLDIPRLIVPFYVRQTSAQRGRTLMSIGYNYRFRLKQYDRQLTNLSFGYSWRHSRATHTLFPLDISLVNISLSSDFLDIIKSLDSERLRNQYKDEFIFAARYGFSFSGQQGNRPINFNAFRFSVESSGNSLYALSNMLDAPKRDDRYRFFHLNYAQYLRTDADFRRYWFLTDNQILVTRLMGGVGVAYGNSPDLPYDKGFFAGGNNNIRAWPMNQLGPGSFFDPELPNIERIGDIVLVGNIEYRFPIAGNFKGALFVDAGNIWLRKDNETFSDGKFKWKNVPNDLAVGGGFGLRWDLNFLILRLDAAVPLRNPAKPDNEKWVVDRMKPKDFVLNFGIGYPF